MVEETHELAESVKSSVMDSGVIAKLKQATAADASKSHHADVEGLRKQVQATIEEIQQMLDSGNLDDGASQKLSAVLSKLRGALQRGAVSREALAAVLSEATSAISTADNSGKATTVVTSEQLWQQVENYNHEINDDFEKMRNAGVLFDEKLWNKHRQLLEQLRLHPHDINNQKALDAVDDQLLHQAEPQLAEHPNAKHAFDDAKKKSDDRHKVVDRDLTEISKKNNLATSENIDWDSPAASDKTITAHKPLLANVTMDDVSLQTVGQKPKPVSKTLS